MTGAYLRVSRNGKWENIEVEYLTDDERSMVLGKETNERLLQWIALLARTVRENAQIFDDLVADGILDRQ